MSEGCVLGAFRLERPLARGGMAEVWAAVHRRSGMPVSIKVITAERAHDSYFRSAFLNEVRAVAGLDHPGVVLVLDYGLVPEEGAGELVPGCPYLVMEPASEGTLHDGRRRVLVWPEIRTILLSLLGALGHAHARGVIHRDLKPGNVLVCGADDPRPGLKLSDFGLARHLEDHERPGSVEAVRGTLHYMAPEQCQGRWRDQGAWTDLYALGCIAYQMATGRPPFKGLKGDDLMRAHVQAEAPPLPPRRGLPDGYADWVSRLLRKEPKDRFLRAADAAWALSRLPEPDDVGPTRWVFPVLAHSQGLSDDLETDPTPRTPLPGDLDGPPHGPPTERHAHVGGGTLGTPARRGEGAPSSDVPPIPPSWREAQAPAPDLRLVDAGLGLFDLRPLALVGRDAERDLLWDELRATAASGHPRCVALVGAHGSGTSRIASWLGSRAHEVGAAHVFLLRHTPTDPPLRPLRRMISRALGTGGLSRVASRVRIGEFAARHGLDEQDVGALVQLLRPDGRLRVDSPQERYALVARLLACYARERTVVLRAEDLHWSTESLGLVRFLLRLPRERAFPLLLLCTYRRDAHDRLAAARLESLRDSEHVTVLTPGRLPPADMQTLLVGRMRLCTELALRVQEVVRGNPLFAVQLVADWADRGLLVPAEDGFDLRRGASVQIPDDLHQAWDARVAHALTELPRRADIQIERAAVLGEVFDTRRWAAVCALDDPRDGARIRDRLIDVLLDHGLIHIESHRCRFAHTLLRESLLRRAREAGRLADHHHACARVLERETELEGRSWRSAEALGRHRYAAGDRRGALSPLLEAAEGWSQAGGHRESLALVAMAETIVAEIGIPLTDSRQVRMVHLRVVCHLRRGETAEADAWTERALALAERVDDRSDRVLLNIDGVRQRIGRGDWSRAEALMRKVREDLRPDDPPRLRLEAFFCEGHLARGQGRLDEAGRWLHRVRELAESVDDVSSQGSALRDLGVLAWLREDVEEAKRLYSEARDVLSDGGSLKDLAAALNNLGECYRALGDLDESERYYRRSASLFTRAGASAAAPYPYVNLGLVLVMTGRHQEALGALTRALEEVRRQGNTAFESIIRLLVAPCCAALGDWAGWTRQLDRLVELGALPTEVEPEMVHAIRGAADRALQAQRTAEALRGWALTAQLYRQLDDIEAADAADAARELIESA